tara:strand:+ start:34 stop:324 length:291 start_codon:yes stop_codon:yes gene_type:complete
MSNNFKPIHFYNHSTNESFQITSREGLINWINDFTENHNAFDSYEELKERCLEEKKMSKCKKCGEIDSITYQDENNNIINPKCINCGLEEKEDENI